MTLLVALTAGLAYAGGADAAMAPPTVQKTASNTEKVKLWPAVAGMSVEGVVAMAQKLPAITVAPGQPRCDARAAIDSVMRDEYAEAPVARIGGDLRLFASGDEGTFTVVLDRTSGSSCVIASGIGYGDTRRAEIIATLSPVAARIALR